MIRKMNRQVDKKTYRAVVEKFCVGAPDFPHYGKGQEVLDLWAKNKRELFKLFGEQLTVEVDTETYIDDEDFIFSKRLLLERLRSEKRFKLASDLIEAYFSYWDNDVEMISNNLMVDEDRAVLGERFNRGCKISSIFRTFVGEDDLNDFDSHYSMFLQSLKTTGRLVLSIDPNDFLTASENHNNWSTCHSLEGGYVSGNVSYMVDKTTVVAYLRSDEIASFGGYEWNNKKWRQFIFVNTDDEYFIQSRGYPNKSHLNDTGVREKLVELLGIENTALVKDYEAIYNLVEDYIPKNGSTPLFYNDITKNISDGYAMLVKEECNDLSCADKLKIGGYLPCLTECCDEELNLSDSLVCSKCYDEEL